MKISFKKMITTISYSILAILVILFFTGTNRIETQSTIIIDEKIDKVWETMGLNFADVHLWSSNFKTSKPEGIKKFEGINYSKRVTTTERGLTIQELDNFDNENFRLQYHITEGKPPIAKEALSNWYLEETPTSQTKAVFEFTMVTRGAKARLLSFIIKRKIQGSGDQIANELKAFIEN